MAARWWRFYLDREAIAVGAYAFLVKGCQVQRICQLTDQAWAHA
jgi:hypothetical protein